MRWAVVGAVLALAGCADFLPPHTVTLMAADGSGGIGTATRGAAGTISADVDGVHYSGTYVSTRGGAVGSGFGSGTAGSMAFSSVSSATESSGRAMMRGAGGGTLQCSFTYDGLARVGYGACFNAARKRYELQIL